MKSEIKIAHPHLETPLVLSEDFPQLLIVENPNEFYFIVNDLVEQFEGKDGQFVFSCEGQIVKAEKYGTMIYDLFHFDLNDKKILSILYKKLEEFSFGEKIADLNGLNAKVVAFLEDLSFNVPFPLDYNEPQPLDYFKIAGIKFAKNYDNLEEKIICYVNALIELKNCEFFVFVNLKSVLTDEKLQQVYNHCKSEQVGVLLIENSKVRRILPCEKAIIITEDLCEILENYEEIC